MTPAPHPLDIRTRLMCALLGAGHDVPTAQQMMTEALAAIHYDLAPWFHPQTEESTSKDFPREDTESRQVPPEKRETVPAVALQSHCNPIVAPEWRPAGERIKELATAEMSQAEIAAALGISIAYTCSLCKKLGLPFRRIEKAADTPRTRGPDKAPRQSRDPSQPKRRFTEHKPLNPEAVAGLDPSHDAVREGRTLFPTTVVDPKDSPRLLVSGEHNRKIGDRVTKGPWAGMPIFVLTLEERATCPSYCHHWHTCMGNGMPQARRHRHGLDLELRLERELAAMQTEHPKGFVVRLHQLGDFYSVEYVQLWLEWLHRFPALHAFGYTAWSRDSDIGAAIAGITALQWDRFAIRFSDAAAQPQGATTIWRLPEGPTVAEGIVCPAQTNATACCGTCGLCWSASARDKTIVFVGHGRTSLGNGAQTLEKIKALDTRLMTAMDIAETVGVAVPQVYSLCRQHEIPFLSALEKREREKRAYAKKANAPAAKPWPAELRKIANREAGDPIPETRKRLDTVVQRRCDCGQVFQTDVVDQTMCASCTENAARHRELQAQRTGA